MQFIKHERDEGDGSFRFLTARWLLAAAGLMLLAFTGLQFLTLPAGALNLPSPKLNVEVPEFNMRKPPPGTRVIVDAERLTYDPKTQIATATGRVILTYGPYVMVASHVTYNRNTDVMRADGNIRLREPNGNILEADLMQLQNKFRDGFAQHLRLLLTNEATVTADYAVRREGRIMIFDHATYTRCKTCVLANGEPLWQIKSRKVTHDNVTHIVTHEDMTFHFGGVPVFWLPKFTHTDGTLKRATGFLSPTFAVSSDIGLGIAVPYYIALAPSYDLTLLPLITSKQGVMPRAEWRQRTATGQYSIDAAGIYQLNTDLPPPGDRRWRGFVRTQGDFDINDHWSWGWDATAVSDDTFGRRYDLDRRTDIVSDVYLTGMNDRNFFRARAMHFDNLVLENGDTTPIALPFIEHDYTFNQPVVGGELGITSSAYSLFRQDSETPYPDVNHGTTQTRVTSNIHWQRQLVSNGGLIATPFARLRGDLYINHDLPDLSFPGGTRPDETTGRFLPSTGVDLRWPFVRVGASGQHVISPVAQVIAATNETNTDTIGNEDAIELNFDTSNLFLQDKFSGFDRFEGGTRVNTGLLYSYLMANGGFLRVSAGESFHVAGENSFATGSGLEDSHSDIVAAIAYQPSDNLRFSYQTRLANSTSFNIRAQEAAVDLDLARWSLHAGLSDIDSAPEYGRLTDERQAWAAASVMVAGGWGLFGGLRYDLVETAVRKETIGIQFDCDCFNFRLAYTRSDVDNQGDLNKSYSILFSVNFKTLGGTDAGN